MPDSRAILLPRRIEAEEARAFIEAEGGEWQDWDVNPDFRQGVIEQGNVWLFIRGVDSQESDLRFVRDELAEAEQACGVAFRAVLTVDHTRGPEGESLATKVIADMIARWGGYELG